MMKQSGIFAALGLLLAVFALDAIAVDGASSLRGYRPVEKISVRPAQARVILPDKVYPRSYKHAPPLIPHRVDQARISLKKNQCLGCHSDLEAGDIKATPIGKNHYVNRKGERTGYVSTRYYFCTQCHAPQMNKPPLVDNRFNPEWK